MRNMLFGWGFALALAVAAPAGAQGTDNARDVPRAAVEPSPESEPSEPAGQPGEQMEELRRRLDILAAEIERLRSGDDDQAAPLDDGQRRALGLAPSASATYRRRAPGVSFAGYGEMLLENFADQSESGVAGAPTTRLDFLRAILYAGYRFSDRFVFNSEIEFEHGNELFVEFAYLDYLVTKNLTVRGGMLLLPLGLVNEFHEPNVFLGAKRPETEQRLIPSTFRENGAGLLASVGRVNVRAYLTNGLNAAGYTSAGLRGGRQRGIQTRAANFAFTGRMDVTPVPGVFAGVGLFTGGAGQEQVMRDGQPLTIGTTLAEGHVQAQIRGFDIRGLYARATVDEAREASLALRLPTTAPIAELMQGGYVQFGYNLLSQRSTTLAVTPYVRLEHVNTQARIPEGFTKDRARDGGFRTFGLDVKPIPNIVLKTEYQWVTNDAGTGRGQFNINLGYSF